MLKVQLPIGVEHPLSAAGIIRKIPRQRGVKAAACVGLIFGLGCDFENPVHLPQPSKVEFREVAYPVLLRDCSFAACHGNPQRMFQIYGPGRVRMSSNDDDLLVLDPPTEQEIDFSYERARAMLLYDTQLRDALLLHKPLQGSAHQVSDHWGRNVYAGPEAQGYQVLFQWAHGSEQP